MNAIEIFQKKKGGKVEISFKILVDQDQVPSAVNTIRRKLTSIDMNQKQSSEPPIFRASIFPMAG